MFKYCSNFCLNMCKHVKKHIHGFKYGCKTGYSGRLTLFKCVDMCFIQADYESPYTAYNPCQPGIPNNEQWFMKNLG